MKIEELCELLKTTEPLSPISLQGPGLITFDLPAGWNVGLKEEAGTSLTEATMTFGDATYTLTKDAVLQATSAIGLTKEYAAKTPGPMIAEHLNYWYGSQPPHLRLFAVEKTGLALVKGQSNPLSNVAILETVLEAIEAKEGLFAADPVIHDLRLTQFRVVAPGYGGIVAEDGWYYGVDVQNSLTAEASLQVRAYLHLDHPQSGGLTVPVGSAFSRKGNPEIEAALEWVSASTENVIVHLDHVLDDLESLTKENIEGALNHTVQDVFERYKVPAPTRPNVMSALVDNEDYTMYGVVMALAQVASLPDTPPVAGRRLREIAGDLTATGSARCGSCHRLPI